MLPPPHHWRVACFDQKDQKKDTTTAVEDDLAEFVMMSMTADEKHALDGLTSTEMRNIVLATAEEVWVGLTGDQKKDKTTKKKDKKKDKTAKKKDQKKATTTPTEDDREAMRDIARAAAEEARAGLTPD